MPEPETAAYAHGGCFLTGCTSVVWYKSAFNSYCRPANPTGLELSYSSQQNDILVRYDGFNEHNSKNQRRSYWLMSNAERLGPVVSPIFWVKETGRTSSSFR